MTVTERLRELDRRAGFGRQPTEEQWRRAAQRWPWLVVVACLQVLVVVVTAVLRGQSSASASGVAFVAVWLAFLAGQWKAENDRLRGREGSIAGQRRPRGL